MLKGFVSHPIPSSSGHLQTQCSPSSSHEGFVSVYLESFQTRIHPIPSFSDHISRALLILLPSNLPLKVWYVSLNYFQPRIHPTPSSGCPQMQSSSSHQILLKDLYLRLNSSSPKTTLYHHLPLYQNPVSSSRQIVLRAVVSVRLESFQTRIHPILSSGSLRNPGSSSHLIVTKSLASIYAFGMFQTHIHLVPSKPVNLQKPGCSSSSHQIILQASYLYAWILLNPPQPPCASSLSSSSRTCAHPRVPFLLLLSTPTRQDLQIPFP